MDMSNPSANNGVIGMQPGYSGGAAPNPQPVINDAPTILQQQALQQNNPMRLQAIIQQLQNPQRLNAVTAQISDQTKRAPQNAFDALAQIGRAYDGSNAQAANQMQDPNSGFWSPTVTPGG